MNKLEETVLKEELKKIKEQASNIAVRHLPVGLFDAKAILGLSEEEIKKISEEGWLKTYEIGRAVEKSVERIELVLESMSLNNK